MDYKINTDSFSENRSDFLENNKNENFELIEQLSKVEKNIKIYNALYWAGWFFMPFINLIFLWLRSNEKTKADEIKRKLRFNSVDKRTNI